MEGHLKHGLPHKKDGKGCSEDRVTHEKKAIVREQALRLNKGYIRRWLTFEKMGTPEKGFKMVLRLKVYLLTEVTREEWFSQNCVYPRIRVTAQKALLHKC